MYELASATRGGKISNIPARVTPLLPFSISLLSPRALSSAFLGTSNIPEIFPSQMSRGFTGSARARVECRASSETRRKNGFALEERRIGAERAPRRVESTWNARLHLELALALFCVHIRALIINWLSDSARAAVICRSHGAAASLCICHLLGDKWEGRKSLPSAQLSRMFDCSRGLMRLKVLEASEPRLFLSILNT